MKATFVKLPEGEWGIRISGPQATLMTGQEIDVSKRSGKTCHQRVGELIEMRNNDGIYHKDISTDCGRRWSS